MAFPVHIANLSRIFSQHSYKEYKAALIQNQTIPSLLCAFQKSPHCSLLHNQVTQLLCSLLFRDEEVESWSDTEDEEQKEVAEEYGAEKKKEVTDGKEKERYLREEVEGGVGRRRRREIGGYEDNSRSAACSFILYLVRDVNLPEFIGKCAELSKDSRKASYGGYVAVLLDVLMNL